MFSFSHDAMDSYYEYIWDVTILEYLTCILSVECCSCLGWVLMAGESESRSYTRASLNFMSDLHHKRGETDKRQIAVSSGSALGVSRSAAFLPWGSPLTQWSLSALIVFHSLDAGWSASSHGGGVEGIGCWGSIHTSLILLTGSETVTEQLCTITVATAVSFVR